MTKESSIDFYRLYENIFKVLPSGNIQKMMEVCYDIVGVPILTVDIMYNLFGIAPRKKTGDYYWDYLLMHHGYEIDMAMTMYDQGIMQSVNKKKSPYIINWGDVNQGYPKIQGIVRVNDIVEGYVTMQCRESEITPDRMKAMEIIQDALSLFFQTRDTENSMDDTCQKVFIGELFNSRIHTKKQLEVWFKKIGIRLKPPYQIATIATDSTQEKNVLSYIRRAITPYFPYQMSMIQSNVLYLLIYNLDKRMPDLDKKIAQLLTKFNARCGISNPYQDLLETPDYQIQAENALSLGYRMEQTGNTRIYSYGDYYLPAILAPRIEQMPQNNYISPIICALRTYDVRHDTDFLETLQVYVSHMYDTSETAKSLHIHRNTLLYRIHKIEELTGSSLKDYETFMHLMLSFYMMQYSREEMPD